MIRCRQCGDIATHRLPALDRIGSRDGLCDPCAKRWAKQVQAQCDAEKPYPIPADPPTWEQPALWDDDTNPTRQSEPPPTEKPPPGHDDKPTGSKPQATDPSATRSHDETGSTPNESEPSSLSTHDDPTSLDMLPPRSAE